MAASVLVLLPVALLIAFVAVGGGVGRIDGRVLFAYVHVGGSIHYFQGTRHARCSKGGLTAPPPIMEKTIAILGDRWAHTAKQNGDKTRKKFYHVLYWYIGKT